MRDFRYLWDDPLFQKPFNIMKLRRIIAIAVAECFGTGLFCNYGCATVIKTSSLWNTISWINISIGFCFAIGLAVWSVFHISGSVLNPALTLALVILGHFSIWRLLLYTFCQIIGATLGIAFNLLLAPGLNHAYCLSERHSVIRADHSFFLEIVTTFLLCWALCSLVDERRIAFARNISVKFVIVLIPLVLNYTRLYGVSMNPAKTLGAAIVAWDFTDIWVFTLGPYIGAILMAFLYIFMFDASIEKNSGVKTSKEQ